MRALKSILATILAATLMSALSGVASAQTLTATGQLHVTAQVLPVHTIVVDNAGQIIQIYSNTDVPTDNLKVYVRTPVVANSVSLTDEIYAQYQQLVPAQSKVGKLYDRNSVEALLSTADEQCKLTCRDARVLLDRAQP